MVQFFLRIVPSQIGKYRHAPRILVTSEFGFGKTSTLHSFAAKWIVSGRKLIFAPAALLDDRAFASSSGLADALLTLLIPEDTDLSKLTLQLFRDALREALTSSTDWLLLIDGLDENAATFNANSLASLWGSLGDLGVPAILSARDELVDLRRAEFFPETRFHKGPRFERIRLKDWSDPLIAQFVAKFATGRGGDEKPDFTSFRQLVESGRYDAVYGDIPKRPLFLGMLTEDAWAGGEPARQLHRLYGKYFREKFTLDRQSVGATGVEKRPSDIVELLGLEEAAERLIHVMQDAADEILARIMEGAKLSWRDRSVQVRPR